MSNNTNLQRAKNEKNDEFYTQLKDIEVELSSYLSHNPDLFKDKVVLCPCDDYSWSNFTKYFSDNFERLGLRKLISTCYAREAEKYKSTDLLACLDDAFVKPTIEKTHGKFYIKDISGGGETGYLEGDGDFRSDEVKRFRDEADFIITNPPFSLFREFIEWIEPDKRKFSILGTINNVGYKILFPYILRDEIWLGYSLHGGSSEFRVPDDYGIYTDCCRMIDDEKYLRFGSIRWFTNIDYHRQVDFIETKTMKENLENNKKLQGTDAYKKYDDNDAIEVSYTNAIPSDYEGIMGVPLTFLDKYNPEQFEIVGGIYGTDSVWDLGHPTVNGVMKYKRLAIRHRKNGNLPCKNRDKYIIKLF